MNHKIIKIMPFLLAPVFYWMWNRKQKTAEKSNPVMKPVEISVTNAPFLDALAKYVEKHEGKRSRAYDDSNGKTLEPGQSANGFATIGIGHKILSHEMYLLDAELNDQQIKSLFAKDIAESVNQVRYALKVPLKQNQVVALVSFVFNLGIGNAQKTINRINSGAPLDYLLGQWEKYNKTRINGVLTYSEGLHKRRKDEIKLYQS